MSKRGDIIDGTKTSNWSKKKGLIYTCNAGWIDLGHLNPYNSRPEIGAGNLWKNIVQEGMSAEIAKTKKSGLTFKDGSDGFALVYRQDHAGYPFKPGKEGRYIIKNGLNLLQKQRVALSIFMEVSTRFEGFQNMLGLMRLTDSGFSQEDLVSNLIGFYIGIGSITQIAALKACKPVSDRTARKIWDSEGAVGKNKNKAWTPKYALSTCHDGPSQCIDECGSSPPVFPRIFQSVKPIPKGTFHAEV